MSERTATMLTLVGLSGVADVYPHELSGGQQQRVALARALAPAPDLLLLDEPFSNLDVDLRERISLEVRDILKTGGTTALLVTHDQHEAFAIADEIGVMKDGVIEQWDSAYNLYHRPRTRFVADFVGQGVFLRGVAENEGRDAHRARRPEGDWPQQPCRQVPRSICCCGPTISFTTTPAHGKPKSPPRHFVARSFCIR